VPRKRATASFIWPRACIGLALLLSASCSRFPPVSAVDFSPIPTGSARIWFYRVYDPTESKGRPYIYMNGATVGISEQATRSIAMFSPGCTMSRSRATGAIYFNSETLRSSPDSKHMRRFYLCGAGWNRGGNSVVTRFMF
jgi:hypothetical protein